MAASCHPCFPKQYSVPFAVTAAGSEWHASGVAFHCLEISAGTCFWFERVRDAGVFIRGLQGDS